MPAKNKAFVVYPDDTTAVQIEELRQYFSDRQGGIKISDGKLGRDLINEKHTEILNKQNNNARITTLVQKEEITAENLAALRDAVNRLAEKTDANREDIAELKAIVKTMFNLWIGEKEDVHPTND